MLGEGSPEALLVSARNRGGPEAGIRTGTTSTKNPMEIWSCTPESPIESGRHTSHRLLRAAGGLARPTFRSRVLGQQLRIKSHQSGCATRSLSNRNEGSGALGQAEES